MAENGNNAETASGVTARMYADAIQAQLGERVTNLGRRQSDLEAEMRSGFRQVEQSILSFTNETRNSIAAISSTLAERNKPQWQALSVMLAAFTAIGGLVYWPIREGQTRIDGTLSRFSEIMVTRDEINWRSGRTLEDRTRAETAIADLRANMLPRNEWSERNLARDGEIQNIRSSIESEVADLQRQIDLQRGDFASFSSSLGNGRDVIQNLQTEINRLRDQLLEIRAQQMRVGP